MTTLPEEAVKAAKDVLYYANPNDVERALTAAAPHLAAVRVNVDEIVQSLEDIHAPGGLCRWTDVATAIGEVRRALSALEPSAGRAAALEEALRNLLHAVCGETGFASAVRQESGHVYPWPALDIAEAAAIRALSSHPVADKSDEAGAQGEGWLAKAKELYEKCNNFPENSGEGFMALLQLRNHVAEILPTPPSGEVA